MKPSGAHTHPTQGSGGGGLAILLIILVAALAAPVGRAASGLVRVVVEILEVVLVVVASAVGLAVLIGLTMLVVRLRRRYSRLAAIRARQRPLVIKPSGRAGLPGQPNVHERKALDASTLPRTSAIKALPPRSRHLHVVPRPDPARRSKNGASPE